VLALALAFRGRGLSRLPGAAIIAGYLAFVTALAITVARGGVRPAAAVLPAGIITAAGALLLTWPDRRPGQSQPMAAAGPGSWRRRESLLPGWSTGRISKLSFLLCTAVAACDAASGPHLILIGLLITGPCCALLTARWAPTAAAGCFALALGVVLGIPDQIFATITQYAFLAAVAAVAATATTGAAILQHHRPGTPALSRCPPGNLRQASQHPAPCLRRSYASGSSRLAACLAFVVSSSNRPAGPGLAVPEAGERSASRALPSRRGFATCNTAHADPHSAEHAVIVCDMPGLPTATASAAVTHLLHADQAAGNSRRRHATGAALWRWRLRNLPRQDRPPQDWSFPQPA
jgi:hypothetical protein